MKEKKILNYLKENKFIVFFTLLIVIVMVIPLPVLLVEILIALNWILSITLFVVVLCTKKIKYYLFYPALVIFCAFLGFAVNFFTVFIILSKGVEFDGQLIKIFSYFIWGSHKENLINEHVLFIANIVYIVFNVMLIMMIVTNSCTRVSEVAVCFRLDSFPLKLMAIDTEYSDDAITEDEAKVRKEEVIRELDFFCALDGASKFFSGSIKMIIFIIIFSLVCISGIIKIKDESISVAINFYFPFVISSGILCMTPVFLVSLATEIIASRVVKKVIFVDKRNIKE